MGFKHFLEAAGHDVLAVLTFGASAKGQQVIAGVEGAAVAIGTAVGGPGVGAGITAIEGLINTGLKHVFTMQALGTAAAANGQNVTGAQKAAAVIDALTPETSALLQDLGVKNPTADQIQSLASLISQSLVNIVQAIPAPAPVVSTAPTPVKPVGPEPVVNQPPIVAAPSSPPVVNPSV
jgi:hypothetical protein